jgi:hypothetical protein
MPGGVRPSSGNDAIDHAPQPGEEGFHGGHLLQQPRIFVPLLHPQLSFLQHEPPGFHGRAAVDVQGVRNEAHELSGKFGQPLVFEDVRCHLHPQGCLGVREEAIPLRALEVALLSALPSLTGHEVMLRA